MHDLSGAAMTVVWILAGVLIAEYVWMRFDHWVDRFCAVMVAFTLGSLLMTLPRLVAVWFPGLR